MYACDNREDIHNYISNYYANRAKEGKTVARRSFQRFYAMAKACPELNLDNQGAIESLYTSLTGKTPTYQRKVKTISPSQLARYERQAHEMADMLTGEPMSFTDLFNEAGLNPYTRYNPNCAPSESTSNLRRCFKQMAADGVIGCVEVHTCGKCSIRLYHLND